MELNLNLLEVRPSSIRNAGLGCFAGTVIPEGTIMGPYQGRHMTARQRARVTDGSYIWKLDENHFVDANRYEKNNPLRYVNGTKTPNQKKKTNCIVKFLGPDEKKEVYYMTTRTIPRGEELLISYGKHYF